MRKVELSAVTLLRGTLYNESYFKRINMLEGGKLYYESYIKCNRHAIRRKAAL